MPQSEIVVASQTDIALNFAGPFTLTAGADSVFESPYVFAPGVYLWTIRQRNDNSHLIHYVGECVQLGRRQRQHLVSVLGLEYGIFDADKAQEGVRDLLWPGLWRIRTPDGPSKQLAAYQAMHDQVNRYLSVLTIFFAELRVDDQLRKHVEGCIGWNLRNNHPSHKVMYPDDNHVGTKPEKNCGNLLITVSEPIRGLDERIPY